MYFSHKITPKDCFIFEAVFRGPRLKAYSSANSLMIFKIISDAFSMD